MKENSTDCPKGPVQAVRSVACTLLALGALYTTQLGAQTSVQPACAGLIQPPGDVPLARPLVNPENDCLANTSDATRLQVPLLNVQLDFHMIQVPGATHPWVVGSITADPQDAVGRTIGSANYWFQHMAAANNDPNGNQFHNSVIGDSRIRFVLYDDGVSHPNELAPGVYLWPTTQAYTTWAQTNRQSMHVRMPASNDVAHYTYYEANEIFLEGFPKANTGGNVYWGPVMTHEIIHAGGNLGHAHDSQSTCGSERSCDGVDMNANVMCGGTSQTSCGGPSSGCNWNYNNNIMGVNANMLALSPCQWSRTYARLLERQYVTTNCSKSTQDIVIGTGTTFWPDTRFIGADVVVPAGARLVITCGVYMSAETAIVVQRGGVLEVNGGYISRLCANSAWKGIMVEGNDQTAQPDPYATPFSTQAGIVRLNHASISGAGIAVYTTRYNTSTDTDESWNSAYWGGVIHAQNTRFIDNKRAAAFMKYTYPNKSAFLNNHFEEIAGVTNSEGVTVWNCSGIQFNGNTFAHLDREGIFGIDYDSPIMNNHFDDCQHGVRSESTTPISGGFYIADNIFHDNVLSAVTLGQAGAIKTHSYVARNVIDGQGATAGLVFAGNSHFVAEQNTIRSPTTALGIGIYAVSTYNSMTWGRIECNTIEGFWNGVRPGGDNRQLQITGNDISGAGGNGIRKADYSGEQGMLDGQFTPTNCFTNIAGTDLGSIGWVSTSVYQSKTDNSCYDITASGTGWTLSDYPHSGESCGYLSPLQAPGGNQPEATESTVIGLEDYEKAIAEGTDGGQAIAPVRYSMPLSPLHESERDGAAQGPVAHYRPMGESADRTVGALISRTLESGPTVELDQVRFVYGGLVAEGRLAAARKLLPQIGLRDKAFVQIQEAYLGFREARGRYTAKDATLAQLRTFALNRDGQTSANNEGNARAVLWLLTGEVVGNYGYDIAEEAGDRAPEQLRLDLGNRGAALLSPNPSLGSFLLVVPSELIDEAVRAVVVDANGRVLLDRSLGGQSQLDLDLARQPSGVYYVRLLAADGRELMAERATKLE